MPRYKVYNLCAERNLYAPSRVSKCGHLELCPCTPEVTPAKAFCGTVREHVQVGSGVERQKLAHPSSVQQPLACAFEPTAPNPVLLGRGAWHFALAHESSRTANERTQSVPAMTDLVATIHSIEAWLKEDEHNVVFVHCSDGKVRRTCMYISSEALAVFAHACALLERVGRECLRTHAVCVRAHMCVRTRMRAGVRALLHAYAFPILCARACAVCACVGACVRVCECA